MSVCKTTLLAFASTLFLTSFAQAESKLLLRSKFDPSAKKVELFSAMEEKQIEVQVLARNSTGGSLLISNKTEEPLTVEVPDGFVAVPANAQFGGMGGGGMGGMGGGMGGMGGGMGGMGGGGGGQQSMGGGMGGGGMGGMGGGGMGGMGGGSMGGGGGGMGGFFSIPPDKTLKVPFTSVCLNHGLQDPTPRSKYRIIPMDQYTSDPTLQALITLVGSGQLNQQAAQAATWNIANGMSWQQLANKSRTPIPGPNLNYFSQQELAAAQNIVGMANSVAAARMHQKEEAGDKKPTQPTPPRTLQSR